MTRNSCKRYPNYTPLDRVLELPEVRVLRALRHFDLVSVRDLLDAMDLPDRDASRSRATCVAMLTSLRSRGLVERVDYSQGPHLFGLDNGSWYRITKAGREHLRARLAETVPTMPDEVAS